MKCLDNIIDYIFDRIFTVDNVEVKDPNRQKRSKRDRENGDEPENEGQLPDADKKNVKKEVKFDENFENYKRIDERKKRIAEEIFSKHEEEDDFESKSNMVPSRVSRRNGKSSLFEDPQAIKFEKLVQGELQKNLRKKKSLGNESFSSLNKTGDGSTKTRHKNSGGPEGVTHNSSKTPGRESPMTRMSFFTKARVNNVQNPNMIRALQNNFQIKFEEK